MPRYPSRWTNLLLRTWSAWFGSDRHPPPYRRPLRLEPLEGRWVPATLTPTTFADGGLGSGSLRDAVLQFNADTGTDDDIIQLLAGTYALTIRNTDGRHETAGLTGDLNLTQTSHRWIIQGAGPSTIIDAGQLQDRVFQIVNPGTQVVFQDLVIQGGLAQENGSDGAVAGTTDALGGGIFNNGSDVTLENVVLQNNVAQGGDGRIGDTGYDAWGGGFYSTDGSATISDSAIASNQAIGGHGGGGGGNGGAGLGGGLYASGGLLSLTNATISTNTVRGGTGGTGGTTLVSAGPGGNGGAGLGGGVYASGGLLTLTNVAISTNTVSGGSGGRGGMAYSGGGGTGGNGGTGLGGGVYTSGGLLTLTNGIVSSNTIHGGMGGDGGPSGAGVGRGGDGGVAQGGGLYAGSGTLTLSNSTIAANMVRGGDGGNGNNYFGFNDNGGAGQGGGLWVGSGTTASGSFNTIAVNQATGGSNHGPGHGYDGPATGGGLNNQGTLQTDDTILAGNTVTGPGTNTSPDLAGNLGSLGYNLIGNSQGGSGFDPSDLLDTDPMLGPLQDNGGPTQTMALLPGSPALNAGDPDQLGTTDQRGVVRSGGVNIGAFQASATAFLLSAPDMVQSGVPFDVTVTAVDPFGQVAVGYLGTVTFSSTDPDPGVVLPDDYTFTADDGGLVTFTAGITLITPGDQTLTVTDTADDTISGSASVTVDGPVPGAGGHGLGQLPPSRLGARASPAQPPTRNELSDPEAVAGERWLASFPAGDHVWLTVPRLRHQARGETDSWLVDFFGRGDLRGSVW